MDVEKKVCISKWAYIVLKALISLIQFFFFLWEIELYEANRYFYVLLITIIASAVLFLSLILLMYDTLKEKRFYMEVGILIFFIILYVGITLHVHNNCQISTNDKKFKRHDNISSNQELNPNPTYPVEETTIFKDSKYESTIAPIRTMYEDLTDDPPFVRMEAIFENFINETIKMRDTIFDHLIEFDNSSEPISTLINEDSNATDEPYMDLFKRKIVNFNCDEFYIKIVCFSITILSLQIVVAIATYFYEKYTKMHIPALPAVSYRTDYETDYEAELDSSFQSEMEDEIYQTLSNNTVNPEIGTSQATRGTRTNPKVGVSEKKMNNGNSVSSFTTNTEITSVFELFGIQREGKGTMSLSVTPMVESSGQRTREDRNLRRDKKQRNKSKASKSCYESPKIDNALSEKIPRTKEPISEARTNVATMQSEIQEAHTIGRFSVQKIEATEETTRL